MVKKIIRIAVLFVALVILAAGLAAVVLQAVSSSQRFKRMALSGVQGYWYREARFDRISFNLLSGIHLSGFSLSRRHSFREGEFLSCRYATLGIRLIPLLHHELRVGTLTLDAPRLVAGTWGNGVPDFSELSRFVNGRRIIRQAVPLSAPFIANVSINDGRIDFEGDPADSGITTLRDVRFAARDISVSSPFEFEFSGTLERGGESTDVRITGAFDPQARSVRIKNCFLKTGGGTLHVLGTVSGMVDTESLFFDLQLTGDRLVLEKTSEIVANTSLPRIGEGNTIDLGLSGTLKNLKIGNLTSR